MNSGKPGLAAGATAKFSAASATPLPSASIWLESLTPSWLRS
jgi:hypothetical protein